MTPPLMAPARPATPPAPEDPRVALLVGVLQRLRDLNPDVWQEALATLTK